MVALPSLFRRGPLWLALFLTAWVVFLGLPVFVGHRCGVGFGLLTCATVFAATILLGRLAFRVPS